MVLLTILFTKHFTKDKKIPVYLIVKPDGGVNIDPTPKSWFFVLTFGGRVIANASMCRAECETDSIDNKKNIW